MDVERLKVTATYVNIVSIIVKAPTQIFLLPALIPLIPGSDLYYTFLYFYKREWVNMFESASNMLSFAFAIATGMSVVWLYKTVKHRLRRS